MESNVHLVDECVEDFVLGNLEYIVKQEERCQAYEADSYLQQDDSSSMLCNSQWECRTMPSPLSGTMYNPQPILLDMFLTDDLGTPPDTPPIHSPLLHPPPYMGDFTNTRTEVQPLDLRPIHCMSDDTEWDRREYAPSGTIFDINNPHSTHQRPQSIYSASSGLSSLTYNHHSDYSSGSNDVDLGDELLASISIKELNKKLQGYPRDKAQSIKKIRRTLKNRGYAKNCRSKKIEEIGVLKNNNRMLMDELTKTKAYLARVTKERDFLRKKLELSLEVDEDMNLGIGANLNSEAEVEFYL